MSVPARTRRCSLACFALALALPAQDVVQLPKPRPNRPEPDAATPSRLARELCEAIDRGDAAAVAKALAAGADPDTGMGAGQDTTAGRTPLIHAVVAGSKTLLDRLVAAGADLDSTDDGGHTPLMYAARTGNAELVRHLLHLGARPDLAAEDGGTVVDHVAADHSALQSELTAAVAAHAALVAALANDDIDAMRRALQAGASPNGHDGALSPLLWAVRADHDTLVPELLAKGARVDLALRAGFAFATPLGSAANTANFARLQQLLAAGKPNQPALDDALAMAAMRATPDRAQFVTRLLEAGADPSAQLLLARAALPAATAYADFATMKLLLDAGADEAAVDHALVVAAGLVDPAQAVSVVRALLAIGANPNHDHLFTSALGAAASLGRTEVLTLLLPQCDRDALNLAVVEATRANRPDGLRWLVERRKDDLDFSFAPGLFAPALIEAVRAGHLECLDVLLAAGADANLPPSLHHDTPLITAVRAEQRETLARLLQAGADPLRRCAAPLRPELSALDVALEAGAQDLVELLWRAVPATSDAALVAALQIAGLHYVDEERALQLRFANAEQDRQHTVRIRKAIEAFHTLRGREIYGLVHDAAEPPSDAQLLEVMQKRFALGQLLLETPSAEQPRWRLRFRVVAPVDATPARLAQYLQIVQSTADSLERELAPNAKDRL